MGWIKIVSERRTTRTDLKTGPRELNVISPCEENLSDRQSKSVDRRKAILERGGVLGNSAEMVPHAQGRVILPYPDFEERKRTKNPNYTDEPSRKRGGNNLPGNKETNRWGKRESADF